MYEEGLVWVDKGFPWCHWETVTPLVYDGWNIRQDYASIVPKARKLVGWSAFITCLTTCDDIELILS